MSDPLYERIEKIFILGSTTTDLHYTVQAARGIL